MSSNSWEVRQVAMHADEEGLHPGFLAGEGLFTDETAAARIRGPGLPGLLEQGGGLKSFRDKMGAGSEEPRA